MRLLAIRGQNLASLVGFDIPLEDGPLAQAGLFAITGPTGSGKTTLLDALCLALFDRTPRLSGHGGVPVGHREQDEAHRVTANDVRSLLRRGAYEGFAEVDFVGRDERTYRARWSVRRARRRADGKLQKQEMTLIDVLSGEHLGGTKRETLSAIEERLGLSFEQFRRSALLAQNEFAAFLRAGASERSELLERMTGTDIYSRISMAAFQRARDQSQRLEALASAQEQNAVLEDEERSRLVAERAAVDEELTAAKAESERFAESLRWYRALALAKTAQEQAVALLEAARGRIDFLAPEQAEVSSVRAARERRAVFLRHLEVTKDLESALALAAQRRTEQASAREVVAVRVRAVADAERLASEERKAYVEGLRRREHETARAAAELRTWMREHDELRNVGGEDPELEELSVAELDELRPTLEDERVQAMRARRAANEAHKAARQRYEKAAAALEVAERELEALQLSELAEARDLMATQLESARRMLELAEAFTVRQLRSAKLDGDLAAATEQREHWQKQRMRLEALVAEQRPTLQEAESTLDRLRSALDLDSQRAELRDGEECPLCGSLDHPWADGSHAVHALVAEQRSRVESLRVEQSQLDSELARAVALGESAAADIARLATEGKAVELELEQARVSWAENSPDDSTSVDAGSAERCRLLVLELEERHRDQSERLRAGRTRQLEVELQRKSREELRRALEHATATEQESDWSVQVASERLDACNARRYAARREDLSALDIAMTEVKALLVNADTVVLPAADARTRTAVTERDEAERALQLAAERERQVQGQVVELEDKKRRAVADLDATLLELGCSLEELARRLDCGDERLNELSLQIDAAHRQFDEAQGALAECARRTQELLSSEHPEHSEEQAAGLAEVATKKTELAAERRSALDVRLLADDAASERRRQLGDKLAQERSRAERLAMLSELIGSADGKKFRVFAQSLTLDALLAGANRHLIELAPRYRLQRVPGHDLELQVVDRDLGDEVRSVNSLSGGESFLISLALALGLSTLAAQDVRVESLLIDEGFGSLDQSTLEVALSVLDSLQATGCKVGLISHVPGIAERIGARIVVERRGGGKSSVRVVGPTQS